jgi:hypothetical protein
MLHDNLACGRIEKEIVGVEYLQGRVESQTLTIRTLKTLLDQCRKEIISLRGTHPIQATVSENLKTERLNHNHTIRDDLLLQVG